MAGRGPTAGRDGQIGGDRLGGSKVRHEAHRGREPESDRVKHLP